ncbi:hypothetical protein [Hymenobacter arizonensis]|uniref:Uncharacterized protein n=1 Tax=Hymenobacter arizonensis TaxID=1227077 RepID=A0A1I6BP09_HYMAR|nr:hypothetical protein [Hymenobacter arizonensis]SFQ82641.1 hypothetical protein SAMN04515668_4853 [Hymenobacter arizonensis]
MIEDLSIVSTLNLINARVKDFVHLEAYIHSFAGNRLTINVGEELIYYYNFQAVFEDVFMVSMNTSAFLNTRVPWLSIVPAPECFEINRRFRVEIGNTVFQLDNEDRLPFFVAAKSISYLPTVGGRPGKPCTLN